MELSMLAISVRTEFDRLALTLNDFARRQLPFAAARALTATVQGARREVQAGMPRVFDRPTPFAQRGVTIRSATRSNLEAVVLVQPQQAAFLGIQEFGLRREPKKRALVAPRTLRLNQYGNIPYRALARMKGRSDVFVGTVNGVGGFWQRLPDGGLKLLARFEGPKRVAPRPFFFPAVERTLRRDFDRLMGDALAEALRTARP
jgi:hypothetical protein